MSDQQQRTAVAFFKGKGPHGSWAAYEQQVLQGIGAFQRGEMLKAFYAGFSAAFYAVMDTSDIPGTEDQVVHITNEVYNSYQAEIEEHLDDMRKQI